jgi:hypothetical protein
MSATLKTLTINQMRNLKEHILDWLIELEEEKAADFLNDCEIYQAYITTVFSGENLTETVVYDITVKLPTYCAFRKIK